MSCASRPELVHPWLDVDNGRAVDCIEPGDTNSRAFDIVKPPPVRQLEKLPGGWGIMLDDVAAGLLALGSLQLLIHFRVLS